jgi:hypothetical protein
MTEGKLYVFDEQRQWRSEKIYLNRLQNTASEFTVELPRGGRYCATVEDKNDGTTQVFVTVPEGLEEFRRDIELPRGGISGVVSDASTGAPLSRAIVVAMGPDPSEDFLQEFLHYKTALTTDEKGKFFISGLPPGQYTIHAMAEDYGSARIDGIIVGPEPSDVELQISLAQGVPLSLRVVDSQGRPVARASAYLQDAAGGLVLLGPKGYLSDGSGLLHAGAAAPGAYRLTVFAEGFAPQPMGISVAPGMSEKRVTLMPGGSARLQVVDEGGQPLGGAGVKVLDRQGRDASVLTRLKAAFFRQPKKGLAPGEVLVDILAPGTYRAVATRGDFRSQEVTFSVQAGETVDVPLVIPQP